MKKIFNTFILILICLVMIGSFASCGKDAKIEKIYLSDSSFSCDIDQQLDIGEYFIVLYSNGETEMVPMPKATVTANTNTPGTFTGTLSYNGYTYEFSYIVTELRNKRAEAISIIEEEYSKLVGTADQYKAFTDCVTNISNAMSEADIMTFVNQFKLYVEKVLVENSFNEHKNVNKNVIMDLKENVRKNPIIRSAEKEAFYYICDKAIAMIDDMGSTGNYREILEIVEEVYEANLNIPDMFDLIYEACVGDGTIRYNDEWKQRYESICELISELDNIYAKSDDDVKLMMESRLCNYYISNTNQYIDLSDFVEQVLETFENLDFANDAAVRIEMMIENIDVENLNIDTFDELIEAYNELLNWANAYDFLVDLDQIPNQFGFNEAVIVDYVCEDIIDNYEKFYHCWGLYIDLVENRDMELQVIKSAIDGIGNNIIYTGDGKLDQTIADITVLIETFIRNEKYCVDTHYAEYFIDIDENIVKDYLVVFQNIVDKYDVLVNLIESISYEIGRLPRLLPTDPIISANYFERYYTVDSIALEKIATLINDFSELNSGDVSAVRATSGYIHYIQYLAAWETFTPNT